MSSRFAQEKFIFPEKKICNVGKKLLSKQFGSGKGLAASFRNYIFLFC